MGPMLADLVQGRHDQRAADFTRFVPPLPPEPLRWLAIRGMLGVVDAIDRRIDRQLRAAGR